MDTSKPTGQSRKQIKLANARSRKRGERQACKKQIDNGEVEDLTTHVPITGRRRK